MADNLMQEAVTLYKAGDKENAAKLLMQLVNTEPNNADAWYGLALCVDEAERKRYCLQKVLTLNSEHQKAKQTLERLSQIQRPVEDVVFVEKLPKSQSQNNLLDREQGTQKTNRMLRCMTLAGGLGLLVIISLTIGIFLGDTGLLKPSPERAYAEKMVDVLEATYTWFDGSLAESDAVLSERFGSEIPNYTNADALLAAHTSGVFYSVYIDKLASNIMPYFQASATEGFDVLSLWGGVVPPAEISVSHQKVVDCIKYEIDRANAIISFLNSGVVQDVENDQCAQFSPALEKVEQYVDEH